MVNVKDFGATGDGTTDDTNAIQAAINSLPGGNGQVYLPTGTYKVTRTITLVENRVKIRGDGPYATAFLFAPTQEGQTCLRFGRTTGKTTQIGGEDFAVLTEDAVRRKIGIELIACLQPSFVNVAVKGLTPVGDALLWTNVSATVNPSTSIGWYIRGWEAGSFINCSSFADSPLRIGVNPDNPRISIDHFHWQNWYSIANANYNIEIEDGVVLYNVTFDGYQAWVSGLGGLRWIDNSSTVASQLLRVENVRAEQYKTPNAWVMYIDHNSGLYGMQFNNSYGGMGETAAGVPIPYNGIYTRNVVTADIQSFIYTATGAPPRTFYDTVGMPTHRVNFRDISVKNGQLASMVNMRLQQGAWSPFTFQPIPSHAIYTYDDPDNSPQGWARLGPTGKETTFKGTALPPGGTVNLRCGAAVGIAFMTFRVASRGLSRSEGGSCFLTSLGMFKEGGTEAFETTDSAGSLCLIKAGNHVLLKNNLPEAIDWFVVAAGTT